MEEPENKPRGNHKTTEWFSVAGLVAHMSPIGFHVYAENFIKAAKVAPRVNERFAPAQLYLVCHAIELLLKAFLSTRGRPLKELATSAFGHNLSTLLCEAEGVGLASLVDLEPRLKNEIVRASKYYAEKVFEYPALGEAVFAYPDSPKFEVLIEAADALATALLKPCLDSEIAPPS